MYFSASTLLRMINHHFSGYLPWIHTDIMGKVLLEIANSIKEFQQDGKKKKNEILQENIAHL